MSTPAASIGGFTVTRVIYLLIFLSIVVVVGQTVGSAGQEAIDEEGKLLPGFGNALFHRLACRPNRKDGV